MGTLRPLLKRIARRVRDGGPGSGRKPTGRAKQYQPTGRPVGRPKGTGNVKLDTTYKPFTNSGLSERELSKRVNNLNVAKTKEYYNAVRNYYKSYDIDNERYTADPETTAKALEGIDMMLYIDCLPREKKTDMQYFFSNCLDIDDERFGWSRTKELYRDLIPDDDHSDDPKEEETYYPPRGPSSNGIAYPWRD